MPKSAEFVVSAGADIQAEWFQTDDQSIYFTIRHVPGSNATIQRSEVVNNNALISWNHSQHSEHASRTILFRAPRESSSNESDDEQNDKIMGLRQKIEREQAKKVEIVKQHAIEWAEKPLSFFGISESLSSEEWSIAYLFDLDSKRDADRVPFHKLNLANHFKQRIASEQTTEAACRRAMILAKYTDYDRLSKREMNTIKRSFNRHLEQGDTLRSIKDVNAGLLLTVAPFMTRNDLKLISEKDSSTINLTWVPETLFEESRAFEELALGVLASMETVRAPKRTAGTQARGIPPEKRSRRSVVFGKSVCRVDQLEQRNPDHALCLSHALDNAVHTRASTEMTLSKRGMSASQTTSAPTTLPLQGVRAGTNLDDKADPSRVPHSPPPPQALLIPENLFRDIKVYFEDSCRKMTFDDNGILLSPDGAEFRNDLCTSFDSYCFTATMLKERGLHIEFGRALSRASALVKHILRAEHPRTLACFFEVLIHLIQTGLPEVAFALRGFIKEMSAEVSRKENLWSRICRLLGVIDPASQAHAMAQAWRCTTDVYDSVLGTSNRLAVSVRLDYIKRVITDHPEEERLLRDLLAQFGGTPRHPTPRVMLNLAHNLNRQGRHNEAERMALEVLSLLQHYGIYAGRNAERIESLKILSRSQFTQGKASKAEQTMREAIRMIVDQWGQRHSWALEFMNVLEGWLRGWGREEDANTLRGEIDDLMGQDVIDE